MVGFREDFWASSGGKGCSCAVLTSALLLRTRRGCAGAMRSRPPRCSSGVPEFVFYSFFVAYSASGRCRPLHSANLVLERIVHDIVQPGIGIGVAADRLARRDRDLVHPSISAGETANRLVGWDLVHPASVLATPPIGSLSRDC